MADDIRRRTSFEKDMREFFLKVVFGVILGAVLRFYTETAGWFGPIAIGLLVSFFLASLIRGSSHDAD